MEAGDDAAFGGPESAFRDPEVRRQLHVEGVETAPNLEEAGVFTRRWDLAFVHEPALSKNIGLRGKSIEQIASEQGKGIIDALLDLAIEEDLETEFERREVNSDTAAMTEILNSPYAVIGLSDGGAHLAFRTDYSFTTYLLSHWVRNMGIMPLEKPPQADAGLGDRSMASRTGACCGQAWPQTSSSSIRHHRRSAAGGSLRPSGGAKRRMAARQGY